MIATGSVGDGGTAAEYRLRRASPRRAAVPPSAMLDYGDGMDPEGKVVVVTGAAGGIGGALVGALLERGARSVIAADLDGDGVERLSQELGAARVQPRVLDVSDEQMTLALADQVEEEVGPIDVWFANAGLATGSGPDAPDEEWNSQWRINVMSHVYAARVLLPRWIARGEGHLVTTASMAGLLTTAGDAAYSATKHAAVGFAEWLAFTYAGDGVRVSCICPGAVDTAMLRAGAEGDAAKASAVIGGGDVLAPEQAAERILAGLEQDLFLILTHPQMHEFVVGKAQDPERWIRGMTKLWARAQALLGG
jgi:NAD(P)-dependent dehydrogenase (short-subunit alcohol dehydrogenase family)